MKKILILLLVPFLSGSVLNAQKTELRYRLEPGMTFTMETSFQTTMVQKVMGIDQEIMMNMQIGLLGNVKNFGNGVYTVVYQYQRLRINTTSTMFAVEIDTEGPDNPGNNMMRVLIGKPFMVKMDDRGMIRDVQGLDRIIAGIDSIGGIDENTRTSWKTSLEESFGKETFIQNMEQASVLYPEKPVATGDSWQYDFSTTSSNIELHLRNTATLIESGKNTALIRVNSNISTPENDSITLGGNRGSVTMTGNQIAEISIDPSTGLIRESNVSQDIRGNLYLEDDDQPGGMIEVPMTMTSKIQVVLSRKPSARLN